MLGFIALVLIVLWLLGFLAFHISSGLIHVLLFPLFPERFGRHETLSLQLRLYL